MERKKDRKHYVPLESNPEVFTKLIHRLGVSPELHFEDIWTLDEPSFLPASPFALILIFPAMKTYEALRAKEHDSQAEEAELRDNDHVLWFKQTIHNACGLYALLHAVCNGPARRYIQSSSALARLVEEVTPLGPEEGARALEDSDEIEAAHAAAGAEGDTEAPASAESEVDFHYTCFVKSSANGHIYELDGDRSGPIDTGLMSENVFSQEVLDIIRSLMKMIEDESSGFGIMALVGPSL